MRFTFVDSDTGMFKAVMDPALTKPGRDDHSAPYEDRKPQPDKSTKQVDEVHQPSTVREYLHD